MIVDSVLCNLPVLLPQPSIKLYHALIKCSRFKYQYLVGRNINTKSNDVVFIEEIDIIRDDYLEVIRREMNELIETEVRRGLIFSGNEFVYRSNAKTSLDKIVRIYRNCQK